MKRCGLLNAPIIAEIAALGHTEYLCIADCGLPVPKGTRVIDISVAAGVPGFLSVLEAIGSELVVESYILAEEGDCELGQEIRRRLGEIPCRRVPHAQFKELTAQAKCIIRTGETRPFANVILVGGVNF